MRPRLLLLLALLLFAAPAHAHPEGFSGFRFLVYADKAKAIVTLHTRDMGAWFPPATHPDYVNDVCRAIIANTDDLLEVQFDGQPAAVSDKRAFLLEVGLIQVELIYPIAQMPAEMTVWSKHLVRLPRGHQQLFFAEDMRAMPESESGSAIYESILSIEGDNATFEIPQTPRVIGSPPTTAGTQPTPRPRGISFFLLGIEHIVTGYDHLLFLAALLLVSRNVKEAIAVVTFFTVAHSITLSLAALDIVRLPGRIVEPAIAASILYVGVENVVGKHRFMWRALITFAFGLVHGLGFAGALREIGLGSSSAGVVMPLVKFSAGLETGQIAIALVMMQLMLAMRRRDWFERRMVPVCSVLIAAIGAFWLIERVASG